MQVHVIRRAFLDTAFRGFLVRPRVPAFRRVDEDLTRGRIAFRVRE
jgi:hypothetical protein